MYGSLDKENDAPFSIAHLIIILLFANSLLFSIDSAKTGYNLTYYHILKLAEIGLAGCLVLFLIVKTGGVIKLLSGLPLWALLYGLTAMVSVCYSSVGIYTFWKSLELTVAIIGISIILALDNPYQIVKKGFYIYTTLLFLLILTVWIGAILKPSLAFIKGPGLLPQIQGILPIINPNGLGFISAITSLIYIHRFFTSSDKRTLVLFQIVICLTTLIFAQARTSLIGLLIGIIVLLILNKGFRSVLVIAFFAILLILLPEVTKIGENYFLRGQSRERLSAFSGRIYGWELARNKIVQSPWVGYGFAAGGRYDVFKDSKYKGTDLHNAFFEVMISTGIIGFIPWLLCFFGVFVSLILFYLKHRSVLNTKAKQFHILTIATYFIILTRSLTSSEIAINGVGFMLLLLLLVYSQSLREDKTKAALGLIPTKKQEGKKS